MIHTDPSGLCPAPDPSKGRVICVDLFIQSEYILVGNGYGDGRGFSDNSLPDKSRGYLYIFLDDQGRVIGSNQQVNRSCTTLGCYGPYPEYNHFEVAQSNNNGYIGKLIINWSLLNGVSGSLRSSADKLRDSVNSPSCGDKGGIAIASQILGTVSASIPEINGTMAISMKPDGKYFVESMDRDPYPSLEVYYYTPSNPGRATQVIMQHTESGGGPMWGLNPLAPNDADTRPFVF